MNPPMSDDRRRLTRRSAGRPGSGTARPVHAVERLRRLHEVSRLLTAFESVEKTFPSVMAVVGTILPLRSAVLVMKGHTSASTAVWTPAGSPRELETVTRRAEAAFAYLTDQGPRPGADPGPAPARQRFLALPLVVDQHQTFGVLQLEGDVADEMDLGFANAVANQLAVALRRNVAEAERETLLVSERHAREMAEAANLAKDEFLAVLSHELRTPLNAITGWALLLRDGHLKEDEHVKAVDTICRNAEVQKQLIADILDVHSIVSGRLRLESYPVDLGSVIESACDTVKPLADRKQIEVRVRLAAPAATIEGDADRLRQVVWNLVTNAVKFTPNGGHVEVALRAADDRHVEITVSDDGPGIPTAFLPHVFDRFRQADGSRSRRHGGLGLGLAIAQKIVAMHDGTISASNGAEGGAVFTVRLPMPTGPLASARPRKHADFMAEETPSLDGVRVLLVDDIPDDRDVLARLLEQQGAEVLTASSAADGFATLERERPHVLLSDISMPDEDGYAFLRRVRELPADRGGLTPAIAVTAFAANVEREHALAAGFQAHLSQPVDSRVMGRLVVALAARMLRREVR